MNVNPLKDVLSEIVDFKRLRNSTVCKPYVAATDVCSGRLKVFGPKEISVEAVLASACLPFLFQAVQVGGHFYWDGGYSGNPPLFPLIDNTDSRDILIVQINPVTLPVPPARRGDHGSRQYAQLQLEHDARVARDPLCLRSDRQG